MNWIVVAILYVRAGRFNATRIDIYQIFECLIPRGFIILYGKKLVPKFA